MRKFRYKDGDKVRVRPDLLSDDDSWYNMLHEDGEVECATQEMFELRGQVVTIEHKRGWLVYGVYEQEEEDCWTDAMFVDVNRK